MPEKFPITSSLVEVFAAIVRDASMDGDSATIVIEVSGIKSYAGSGFRSRHSRISATPSANQTRTS